MRTSGILFSDDNDLKGIIGNVCKELDVDLLLFDDFAEFLLNIEESNHSFAIIECKSCQKECLSWVKLVKNSRPKLPRIICTVESDRAICSKLYEMKIFYLFLLPVSEELAKEVISAAIAHSEKFLSS